MEINQKHFQRIRAYYKVLLPELTDEAWQYCCENFSIRQVKKVNTLCAKDKFANVFRLLIRG